METPTQPDESLDVAIVGMAGRFPGARNIDEFWANLVQGKESIRRLTDDELTRAGVPRRDFEHPDYVRACPVLEDVDKFDAAFFGLSPRDASVMDPAHRFFLEVAWAALEHSGNTGLPEEGRVGVFAGSGAPLYWMNNVRTHREIMESMGEFLVRHTGNDMNFLATRASYDLDLRGPSINVQTACSSALVAAHMARQSLLARECDMAIIGGSTIVVPMGQGYHYKEGEILSPDGHCRPFDHRSAGTVFGSGTGCLVLKRLSDALDNGDAIHAVIKGSAVNNDGSMKVGFLAPGVEGQAGAIRDALKAARVDARSVSYVEAHGTGTSVGDPIELTALEQAFSEHTADKQFCGVGSAKSNIGHLGEAAAAASLIKVVLALKHRQLPPSLGYEKPNPRFPMDDSPFFVNSQLRDWQGPGPLRAGITALGAGGTNCHLILEEPPAPLPGEGARPRQLLVLSARSKSALTAMSENLAVHLQRDPQVDLADVAYTLGVGRRALPHRRVLSVRDAQDAIGILRGENASRAATTAADLNAPQVVYTFPGGGAQYARMCVDLYETEPVYRAALDECFDIIDRELDPGIRALLFAAPEAAEAATRKLQRPSQALPTLFAVEYSLVRLFQSYGIAPSAFVGHSMGEYVAACLAGVFSLRDGLRLVHLRGRLFEKTQPGKMVGVSLSEAETRRLMPPGLSVAAVNAPDLCVASGPTPLIEQFTRLLTEKELDWTPIHIDVAAHSSLLDPILPEFRAFCRTIDFKAPDKPIASNLTGRWLTAAEATDPEYWVDHLRSTVRFADCIETVLEGGPRVFLEIGPGRTLTTLVGAQKTKVRHAVNSVRHPKEPAHDMEYALLTLGKVWAAGAAVDWTAFYDGQIRNRVPLPTYPFEGQSYWVEPRRLHQDAPTEPVKRENMDEWFQTVVWETAPLVTKHTDDKGPPPATRWLIVAPDGPLAQGLSDEIARRVGRGADVVLAVPGPTLRRIDSRRFEIEPGSRDQYRELLEMLAGEDRAPQHVVMLQPGDGGTGRGHEGSTDKEPADRSALVGRLVRWGEKAVGLGSPSDRSPHVERIDRDFFQPVHLAQAIGSVLESVSFTIVTECAFSVRGERLDPFARLALGAAQVIPRELPEVLTRLVDVGPEPRRPADRSARVQQLARELLSASPLSPVVLRQPARFVRRLRPVELPSAAAAADLWRDGDVVLITGGLGGIGLALAEHLARSRKVRLALLSREGLPEREQWPDLLKNPKTPDSTKRRIAHVRAIEALGAQVLPVRGDVADQASLRGALAAIETQLGTIDVVIHAAGVMDDEPLHTKTDDGMRRVLAAKVLGTINLDQLMAHDLRAFVMMSSVASFLGLPGQVDYTAANAFLDAFAQDREARSAGRTLAINWNAWRDIGMAVDFESHPIEDALPSGRCSHPWLDAVEDTDTGRRYFTDFSVESHWLLSEHQIEGADALIPGTGFVELARAAAVDALSSRKPGGTPGGPSGGTPGVTPGAIELRQVTFLSPFQVPAHQVRRMQIDVDWTQEGVRVELRTAGTLETHMTAEVHPCVGQAATATKADLLARTPLTQATRDGFLDQDFVRFGGRWQNIEQIRLGDSEAVLTLALREPFVADLGVLAYHPAVLDMATGAAQKLIPGFRQRSDFWVPFGYDRIRIFAPVPRRVVSHVLLRSADPSMNVASFDVRVFDEAGRELIAIEGFTMKRVDERAGITQKSADRTAGKAGSRNAAMEALLREAITRDEGLVAFDRAFAQRESWQIVASSVDVDVWLKKLVRDTDRLKGGDAAEAGPSFARPALDSDFVPPDGPLETSLAAIWSKFLGVTNVGVLDDFFALGGNSLIAVRFFARVKKDFGVTLPLSTLFQAPTIRSLAAAMRDQGYVDASPPTTTSEEVPVTNGAGANGSSAHRAKLAVPAPPASSPSLMPPLLIRAGRGRPPIFFVHDGLGEVLLYRTLALNMASGHAIYGLEPETAGGRILHTRITDMARAKIQRIQSVQPTGPYLLAGLCAGGVVAFEMARQLQELGEQTLFVGLIDAVDVKAEELSMRITKGRFQRIRGALTPPAGQTFASHVGSALPVLASKASRFVKYELHTRIERARTARKLSALRSAPAAAPIGKDEDIRFLQIYELAHKEHVPHGVFHGGEVVLFRATVGDGSPGDQPFREIYADPLLGWGPRVTGEVQVIDVPGGHSSALQEPHVATLAREIQRVVDRVLTQSVPTIPPGVAEQARVADSRSA